MDKVQAQVFVTGSESWENYTETLNFAGLKLFLAGLAIANEQ